MLRTLLIVIFIFHISFFSVAQNAAFVKVEVELNKPLPERQALHIRGDHGMMGKWEFGKVRLAKKRNMTWSGIFLIPRGDSVSFLLDGGHPDKGFEPADTFSFVVRKDTSLNIKMQGKWVNRKPEFPQGIFYQLPMTTPEGLRARTVTVRTPHNYTDDTLREYPVLYLLDGQSLFDTEGSPDGYEWRLDETLDSLEHLGLIEPIIVVGIDHVFETRSVEYSDTEIGARFRSYISEDLVETIDQQFRTKDSAEHRLIGGAVAGGFVSLLTAWESSDVFGKVMVLSPAVRIYDNDIFPLLDSLGTPEHTVDVFMDVGEFGLDEKIEPGVRQLKHYLDSLDVDSEFKFVPNSIPDGENMAERIKPALLHFFGKGIKREP
ncbi:MAG: alpha/beta hydrolase-fold protein [Saprospiraceae bacterium]|nr:alpha/beta hydrolase-fold protein [Saprospiraceae bacterium]